MIQRPTRSLVVMILALTVVGCAQPASLSTAEPQPPAKAQPSKTLVIVLRQEPVFLAGTAPSAGNITTGTQKRIFNAGLTQSNGQDEPIPYLAESIPQLNTDSWRLQVDGRMETIWRLKPNLTWHDGTPLDAADFVLAWRVYKLAELGVAGSTLQTSMDEVSAPDARTLAIKWRVPYPDAYKLALNFVPVPRHILQQPFEQAPEGLVSNPYWSRGLVGLGPYRIDQWEPGAFIEAAAFGGHAWGRPKIDRLRLLFMPDPNVALTALLSGQVHMPADDPIRVQQAATLAADWGPRAGGTIQYRPTLSRFTQVQYRPEYANPKAVMELPVRKALAHTIDKVGINEALLHGNGILADTLIAPGTAYSAELDRVVPKYPYDLQRSAQLMAEAGYRKGPDGFYVSQSGERLVFEIKAIASDQNSSERAIMADSWRRSGFAFEENDFTPAQAQQGDLLGQFRSLSTTSGSQGEGSIASFASSAISRPENGWRGMNRGGWVNPEYDRLAEAFSTTLDRNQRTQRLIQAVKIWTDQLVSLPLYFNPSVLAYASNLKGVNVGPTGEMSWNIHEWELT